MRILELLSLASGLSTARRAARAAFEAALAAYRGRDRAAAGAAFTACLDHDGDDGPAKVFLKRVARLQPAPTMDNWDGEWHLTAKDRI